MSLIELAVRMLIVIPFLDVPAAWILVRAARRPPRVALLYDRARAGVIGTLAAELGALLAIAYVNGIHLPPDLGAAILLAALIIPGLVPIFFLFDYLLGRYDDEE